MKPDKERATDDHSLQMLLCKGHTNHFSKLRIVSGCSKLPPLKTEQALREQQKRIPETELSAMGMRIKGMNDPMAEKPTI